MEENFHCKPDSDQSQNESLQFGIFPHLTLDKYQAETELTNIYSPAIRQYVDSLGIRSEAKAANLRQLLNVIYVTLGMAGETGELCNKLKKVIRDDNANFTAETLANLSKENGDVTWYNAQLFARIGRTYSNGAAENLTKLNARKEQNTLQGSGDNR